MGSSQSYISPETAITVLVVAGAIGLGYTQIGPSAITNTSTGSSRVSAVTTPGESSAKKGKKKKQKTKASTAGDTSEPEHASEKSQLMPAEPEARVVAFPEVIPGQFEPGPATPGPVAAAAESASKAKKSKKKKAVKPAGAETPAQAAAAASSADYLSESSSKPTKSKNAKRQQQQAPPASSSSHSTHPHQNSTTSIDTDGSWTRVGSTRRTTQNSGNPSAELNTSDAGLTPSGTGNSSPVAERGTEDESFLLDASTRDSGENRRRTLAEKLLPKPRKTGVDDMLETPDYPFLARVMRVQPMPDEKPASGFSWGDYEDVRVTTDGGENDADGEDDGWGVVKSKRTKGDRASPTSASQTPQQQSQKPSEAMTKRQRQNAQKRDSEKAGKAAAETERLAALAKHKRELEKVRMAEQYGGKSGGKASSSGGMKATVDERGKLVWE